MLGNTKRFLKQKILIINNKCHIYKKVVLLNHTKNSILLSKTDIETALERNVFVSPGNLGLAEAGYNLRDLSARFHIIMETTEFTAKPFYLFIEKKNHNNIFILDGNSTANKHKVILKHLDTCYYNLTNPVSSSNVLDTTGHIIPYDLSSFAAYEMFPKLTLKRKESKEEVANMTQNVDIQSPIPNAFTAPPPPPPLPSPPIPRTTNGTKKSQNKRPISPNRTKVLDDIRNNTKKLKSAANRGPRVETALARTKLLAAIRKPNQLKAAAARELQPLPNAQNTQKPSLFDLLNKGLNKRKPGRNVQSSSSNNNRNNSSWE